MVRLEVEKIYDLSFDLMNIRSCGEFEFSRTVVMKRGVNIDFDVLGVPFAVEFIDLSRILNLRKDAFNNMKMEGEITVNFDSIRLRIDIDPRGFTVSNRKFLDVEVSNDYGIRSGQYNFSIVDDV